MKKFLRCLGTIILAIGGLTLIILLLQTGIQPQEAVAKQPDFNVVEAPAESEDVVGNVEYVASVPVASPYKFRDVDVVGNYAYIAAYGLGLGIVDVSDPTNPGVPIYIWSGTAVGVEVSGDYAYVAGDAHGLFIFDITDPTSPSQAGRYDPPNAVEDVVVDGDVAYLAEGTGGLRVVDVSDRSNPDPVVLHNTPGNSRNVVVSGNYAYVADQSGGLRVLDVSNPTTPSESDYFEWTEHAWSVDVKSNTYAFVGSMNGLGMRVVDISDPTDITEVGHWTNYEQNLGLTLEGDYAYLAANFGGLRVIDVSDPTYPWEAGYYNTNYNARKVDVEAGYVYVADDAGGLVILRFLGFDGFNISGHIQSDSGDPLSSVYVSAGGTYSDTTDASGNYTITGLIPNSYTLTPSLTDYIFTPVTRSVTVGPDATTQDFVGAPACPQPLTDVSISGPTEGYTNTLYAFTAVVSPTGATEPVSSTWSPEPVSGQDTATAQYNWNNTDVYSITIQAENCGGLAEAGHTILIGDGEVEIVDPAQETALVYTDAQGNDTTIDVPAGAVTETTTLVYSPEVTVTVPVDWLFGNHAFQLNAYMEGIPQLGFEFQLPISVTVGYSDADVMYLREQTLELWYWDGDKWSTDGITIIERDTFNNQLVVTIEHLSEFAMFGEERWIIFLPLITNE